MGKEKKQCVVYSTGSNNWSFEESTLERLRACKVVTFDHTIVPRGVPHGVAFTRQGLAATNT